MDTGLRVFVSETDPARPFLALAQRALPKGFVRPLESDPQLLEADCTILVGPVTPGRTHLKGAVATCPGPVICIRTDWDERVMRDDIEAGAMTSVPWSDQLGSHLRLMVLHAVNRYKFGREAQEMDALERELSHAREQVSGLTKQLADLRDKLTPHDAAGEAKSL